MITKKVVGLLVVVCILLAMAMIASAHAIHEGNSTATMGLPDNATAEEKRIADCVMNTGSAFEAQLCIAEPKLKCGPSGIPTEEQGICINED